jgi:hypothetical protein
MTEPDDFALKRTLDALPRSIEPAEDLWPGVHARLARRPARRSWHWPSSFEPRTLRIAAGLGVIGVGLSALAIITRAGARWDLATLDGAPRLEGSAVTGSRRFPVGTVLATDDASRARITVGSIGQVEVDRGTEVRLLAARAAEHRLALHRGFIHARIDAPPRLFIVETPAGTAVDLGCEYTLHVDSTGLSVLHVTAGWVEFTERGATSLVPAGFITMGRPGRGIGIPVRERASVPVRQAATALDTGAEPDSALPRLLRHAERADAVTLWHALQRAPPDMRPAVYDRLAAFVPPPQGVTRTGVLAGDGIMLRLWWEQLPGTLPITPDWLRRLWMAWLRVASWL